MSLFDMKRYFYKKWQESEILEEKFQILIDFVMATDEQFAEHFFGQHFDDVWYFDKYEIEDYMLENVLDLDALWILLIKYDEENEEED